MTWELVAQDDELRALLEWRESGVPMPQTGAPRRRGYGAELIEKALPYQLKARTQLEYGPDGVRCMIAVPVRRGARG